MPRANPAAPVWSWADDHSSATATFTCTDSRCKHQETVDANVTSEKQTGKITYTATTEMNGRTYTDTKETDREYFVGHSLSLNGDIGVNFYLDLTDREIADGAKVDFAWTVNGTEKTSSIGTNSYDYAVLDYVKRCLESDKVKPETKELVAATFRYNQAANTYFGR